MSLAIDHPLLPKVGDTVGGKYRLACVLGSGGMGVVFGATHLITNKRVAIKWLASEGGGSDGSDSTKRFMREARLAGEFQHPNIVQIYDFGKSNGSFYMVMEWLEGESLAARLEREQRLSFAQAMESLIPCMLAMQLAHDVGIIHRDLKPANIFLCSATADKPAVSKVLDFGISKRINGNTDVGSLVTKTGMLIGTPQYLSPEQLRARPVDCRTDIYGFGVMLYETLAGTLPFAADNFGDLVVQISTGTPTSLRQLAPDLPIGVEQIVGRAMAREPDERFQSLHELVTALEAVDPSSPLMAATMPTLESITSLAPVTRGQAATTGRPLSGTRKIPVYLVGVGGLAALVVALWWGLSSEQQTVEPEHVGAKAATSHDARNPLDRHEPPPVEGEVEPHTDAPQQAGSLLGDIQELPLGTTKADPASQLDAATPAPATPKSTTTREARVTRPTPSPAPHEAPQADAKGPKAVPVSADKRATAPEAAAPSEATKNAAPATTERPARAAPDHRAPANPSQPGRDETREHNPLHMNIQ